MVSKARLDELLSYDAETGLLTWKFSRGSRKAGSEAGGMGSQGYMTISIDGRLYKSHRVVMVIAGFDVDGMQVDHINGNRSDNRLCNLRVVNQNGNARNIRTATARSRSGVLGVRIRGSGKWEAQLSINNKNYRLGTFDTKEEAYSAYVQAKRKHHDTCSI